MNAIIGKRVHSARRSALAMALLYLALAGLPAMAYGQSEPTRAVAEITVDDDGRNLHYPTALYFDPVEEEVYVVNGGTARVVVFGPDFFPRGSIGAGRSVGAPRGIYVTNEGRVYICQSRSKDNPAPRITILNGAFFVEREILLSEIPEAADFSPRQLAISRDGLIYLVGESSRGVLVLDRDGTFLRRLQPMDTIADQEAITAAARQREEEEQRLKEEQALAIAAAEASTESVAESARPRPEIPEEFRPRSSRQNGEARSGPGLGPVRIRHVSIDSAGNLYLVSAETSKIYVYSPEETFLFSFGEKGGTPRKLSQPRSLAIDEKRRMIYVADYMRHTILVFDMAGKFLFEFGGRGNGPGWFNFPSDLALTRHGQLIVADVFNQRVQVLEVEYGGEFPMFKGDTAPAATPAAAEGKTEAEPAEESAATQEGEAVEEAAPADSPATPEEIVEEVILPEQGTPQQANQ